MVGGASFTSPRPAGRAWLRHCGVFAPILWASLTPGIYELPRIVRGHIHYCRLHSLLHVWMGETPPNACDGVARSSGTCCIILPIRTGKPTVLCPCIFQRFRPILADCYEHPVLRAEISDFQTKMLGWSARSDIVFPVHGRRKYKIFWSEQVVYFYCLDDAGTLATAQRRLRTDIQFACLARPASVLALCSRLAGHSVSALDAENLYAPCALGADRIRSGGGGGEKKLDRALYDFAVDLIDKADPCVP